MREPYGRWTDDPRPVDVVRPATYDAVPVGPVREAELHDEGGRLLGHVWTDDQAAAGFLGHATAGAVGVRAGGYVWAVLAQCYRRGVPAAEVLDAALYEPYRLDGA